MGRTKKELRKPRTIQKKRMKSEYVTREEWGAEEPRSKEPFQLPAYNIMIKYYTDSPPCEDKEECIDCLRDLQAKYMKDGLPDIPYNFLIGGDDRIYEGRGWFTRSIKVHDDMPQWEGTSLDIAYIGQRHPGKKLSHAFGDLMEQGINRKCIVGMFSFEILSGIETPPEGFPTQEDPIM